VYRLVNGGAGRNVGGGNDLGSYKEKGERTGCRWKGEKWVMQGGGGG
jgi:hypothetical protein